MVRLICELHNVILPEYHSIEAQVVSFFTIDLAIKISRHMNIVTMLSYFLITVIVSIMIYHQIDFPRVISLVDKGDVP